MFDNLNVQSNGLLVLKASGATGAEDLLKQFQEIKLPTRIVAIYATGTTHYLWFQTIPGTKIKTKTKE